MKSNLESNKLTLRNGGYFGPKETPYGAVLSAQEKQMAAVIVHLQVGLLAEMRYCQTCIWLNCDFLGKKAFCVKCTLQEGIRYNLHQIMEVEKTNISCLSMPQNK